MIDKAVFNYSKTLVQMGQSNEQLEKWLIALSKLQKAFNDKTGIEKILLNPLINNEKKKKCIQELQEDSNDQTLKHFLFYLIDRKRIGLLPKIIEDFQFTVNSKLNSVEGTVTTALPIDDEVKNRVKAKLEKEFQKKVHLEYSVDSQIIGGMVIILGHEMYDDSIRSRLLKLKEQLLEAGTAQSLN